MSATQTRPTRYHYLLFAVCFLGGVFGGIAQHYLQCDMNYLDSIKSDPEAMPISEKLKALLAIAASVQRGGKQVTPAQIERARSF